MEEADLKSFDTYAWQELQDLRKKARDLSASDFEMYVEQDFTTRLTTGKVVELVEGGKEKQVAKGNVEEFIALVLKARFKEASNQLKWIQEGMHKIVPANIFSMLSWEEIEIRAAGEKTVDPEKLKGITEYESCSQDSQIVKWFWQVFEEMSEEDKQLYLKFVWGRQRLPSDLTNLRYRHTIYYCDYNDGDCLPKAHTCFFQVDLAKYESAEQLEKKLLTAIRFCGDIDDD